MIECDICDKEFPSKKSMTNHRRWHDLPEYKEFQEKVRERVKKIGKNNKGNKAWNKGLTKESDERVLKYAKSNIGKHNHNNSNNPNWKGDEAESPAIHE